MKNTTYDTELENIEALNLYMEVLGIDYYQQSRQFNVPHQID